jgi:hypothetical protein
MAQAAREYVILGVTPSGQAFRPSDWAERLCGVMSHFRPPGTSGQHAHLGYSPYVRPSMMEGNKCVIVDERLRTLEPLAFHFVQQFARDNELRWIEPAAPEPPAG